MARLIDNWLQPIIENNLQDLYNYARDITTTKPQTGDWKPSSPNSQAKYRIQKLVLPRQGALQSRIHFADGAAECLQLASYFDRHTHNEVELSDGRHRIKARFTRLAIKHLKAQRHISLSNLSIGTIIQVKQLSLLFTIKAQENYIATIKTQLFVHSFDAISLKQPSYGRPKSIDSLPVFHSLVGKAVPPSLQKSRVSSSAPVSELTPTFNSQSVDDLPQDSRTLTASRERQALVEVESDGIRSGSRTVHAELSPSHAVPSIEDDFTLAATTMTETKALPLKAASYADWRNFRHLPHNTRRLCVVPNDQKEILDSGTAWLPPDEGNFTSAPLPLALKKDLQEKQLLAERLAGQKSADTHTKITSTMQPRAEAFAPSQNQSNVLPESDASQNEDDESDGESANDSDKPISSWETSPPQPPRKQQENELPPDTPEAPSSMAIPNSPSSTASAPQSHKAQKRSVQEPSSKTVEVASRLSSLRSPKRQQRISLPARPSLSGRCSTPLNDRLKYARSSTANPEEWQTSKWAPKSTAAMVSTPSRATQMAQVARATQHTVEKRRASEDFRHPASVKRRNLGVAFGFSQEPSITRNPNRQTNSLKRDFIASKGRPSPARVDVPSSRVPETQIGRIHHTLSTEPQLQDQQHPKSSPVARPVSEHIIATTSIIAPTNRESTPSPKKSPGTTSIKPLDAHETFVAAYPALQADKRQFTNLCKQLSKHSSSFPKLLWDDFILRYKTDYQPYVATQLERAEVPMPYIEFCSDFDVQFGKRIMNADLLKRALEQA